MKNKSYSTSGVALVIVLGFLVLLSVLAVAFFSSVTTELKGARTFASGVTTRQLADSAVNIVQAQIRDATARENGAWASQPGMIRVYRDVAGSSSAPSKNAEAFFKLYSSDKMVVQTTDLPAFVSAPNSEYDPAFASKPALWTDLNAPVVVRDPLLGTDVPHFPVIDPRAVGAVSGFKFDTGAVLGAISNSSATRPDDNDRLPMPVKWIYVLKDGTLTVPTQAGSGIKATWPVTTDGKMPTKDNPIVGRMGFWADDDCSKVNINTAGGFVNTASEVPDDYKVDPNSYFGSYWDTPRFMTVFDHGIPNNVGLPQPGGPNGGLALTQLLQGEFQRYPGHPMTTSLGVIFGAYMSSQDLWQILPRISTANYLSVASTSASSNTALDKFSYGTNGGTRRVTVGPAAAGGGSDNQNMLPKTERLYASVDELLFATNPSNTAGQDPTQPGYLRQSNDTHISMPGPTKLTPDHLDRLRFFLTANSRAPELNLFGRPRVTIWPVRSEWNTETITAATLNTTQLPNVVTNHTSTGADGASSVKYYPVTPDGGTGLNPYDKVMLFCSTIGNNNYATNVRNSDQAPGIAATQVPYRYIFFRRNPYLSRDLTATPLVFPAAVNLPVAEQSADVTLPRNRFLLETYLTQLTQQPIPGFGGVLKNKLDADGNRNRDMLLTEIFDYCRCANAQDGTTIQFLTNPNNNNNRYFAPRGLMAPSKIQFVDARNGSNVPNPTPTRDGTTWSTGMGRFPTVYEASLVFYYAGPTWVQEQTSKKIVVEKILETSVTPTPINPYAPNKRHFPRWQQLRAFLLLSTFNPMFGYAPMAQPSAPTNGTTVGSAANIEPRISFEISGLEQLMISTKNVPLTLLGFPVTDRNNCKPNTVMYVPSGNAWTGRNMGGYEGFMHTLYQGTNNQGVPVAKIRKNDELYNNYANVNTALPPQFFGNTPPGNGSNNAAGTAPNYNAANQEYYPFQTPLKPYDPTFGGAYPLPNGPDNKPLLPWTQETGILIPTGDTEFSFTGNNNPIVVKVWYDNYNAKGHPINPRPDKINGKDYTPLSTINLKFPSSFAKGTTWPLPKGAPDNPNPLKPYSAGPPEANPESYADFDPASNPLLVTDSYPFKTVGAPWGTAVNTSPGGSLPAPSPFYWTDLGSFAPIALWGFGVPGVDMGISWRDEFYMDKNPNPMLLPYSVAGANPQTPYNTLSCPLEPAWSLASRILWSSKNSNSADRVQGSTGGLGPPYNWYANRWKNIVQPGDTIRSLVYCDDMSTKGTATTATGDLRLSVLSDTNNEFNIHPDYFDNLKQRACSLRTGSAAPYFADSYYGNIVDPQNGKFAPNGPANLPYSTLTYSDYKSAVYGQKKTGAGDLINRGNSGVKGVIRKDGQPGDFDTGMGIFSDGPFANKEDEGNVVFAWWDNVARVYHYPIPYFTDTWTYEKPGNTFTSPLRQLPSPVMFGSLPARAASLKSWETLNFTPYPAGTNHPGNVIEPKDHLLLDLFNMPIVEPYPISEPFSTAGKINMNYRIMPFNYITRSTALRAALAPIRVVAVPKGDITVYKSGDSSGNPIPTNYRSILDCNMPRTDFNSRDPNDDSLTLKAFENFFDAGLTDPNLGMFKSASQICEMPLFGMNVTSIDTYWSNGALTGDNVREKPYADLYPRLTTKSNTYTVHFRVQTLRQVPRDATSNTAAYAVWEEGKDYVMGEYRGATTIERYIDPADTRFNKWTNTGGTVNTDWINPDATLYDPSQDPATPTAPSNPTRSLELVYRFRTVLNKKFAP